MKTKTILLSLPLILLAGCTMHKTPDRPPLATVKPVADKYFGTEISDPYRYMENLADTTVQQWFKAQSDYSRGILDRLPGRKGLIDKMVEFDGRKSARIGSVNITDNDRYFYLKTTPKDQTGKLFYRDGFEGQEELLFDPEAYGSDTTKKYVISTFSPSPDGSKVAFDIAPNGSESSMLMIMDVKTKQLSPEKIDRCWGAGASWLPDNQGILFNRLQSSDVHDKNRELNSKSYLHVVGTDPASNCPFAGRFGGGVSLATDLFLPDSLQNRVPSRASPGHSGAASRQRQNPYAKPARRLAKLTHRRPRPSLAGWACND